MQNPNLNPGLLPLKFNVQTRQNGIVGSNKEVCTGAMLVLPLFRSFSFESNSHT